MPVGEPVVAADGDRSVHRLRVWHAGRGHAAESAVIQSWDVEQLDAAATEQGTQNKYSKPIYEKTGTTIGRHAVVNGGNWLFHSVIIPREKYSLGDKLEVQLEVWFNNTQYGNSMPIEPQWVAQKGDAEFRPVEETKTFIADATINAAPVLTNEALGYQYKEVSAEYTVVAADVEEGVDKMQLRVMLNGDEDVNCYGGKVINKTTGEVLFDWDGAGIDGLGRQPGSEHHHRGH